MKITIVGKGAWGTALGSVLKNNANKPVYYEKGQKIEKGSVLIMAVPTQAIREVLGSVGRLEDVVYINSAKGIEKGTHKLPYQIATEVLNGDIDYFSLIGPSFAEEVVKKMPTLVNVGYVKEKNAELVKSLFHNNYFRVRLTKGVRALELASAFKNVYAMACGLAEGLGFRTNTRVKLILIAIEEFYRLSKKLGYKIDSKALPGTIGDLILTCNSEESRNFSFGKQLAKNNAQTALENVKGTVEGFYAVDSVPYFAKKTGVVLPLAHFVYQIIEENNPASVRNLFSEFVKKV